MKFYNISGKLFGVGDGRRFWIITIIFSIALNVKVLNKYYVNIQVYTSFNIF